MKVKQVITTGLALAMLMGVASLGSADMERGHGPMMNRGMMNRGMMNGAMMGQGTDCGQGSMMHSKMMNGMMDNYDCDNIPALSAEQQTALDSVKAKYQDKLTIKENAIQKKITELRTSKTNDATTIGVIKNLKSELYTLKQEYRVLRNELNQEISSVIGSGNYGSHNNMGSYYCDRHNDNHGPSGGLGHMNNM